MKKIAGFLVSMMVLLVVSGCGVLAPQPTLTPETSATPQPSPSPTPVKPVTQEFEIFSRYTADEYHIYVGLPRDFDPNRAEGYDTVYLLDGTAWFRSGLVHTSNLGESGEMPPSIIVGIGYVHANMRGRDFMLNPEAFYFFIIEELIPFIDRQYNGDPDGERTLIGHSMGGYFAIWVLLQRGFLPVEPFDNFISLSGSYHGMHKNLFTYDDLLAMRLEEGGFTMDAKLYMGVGSDEEGFFTQGYLDMWARLHEREYENLEVEGQMYPGLNHGSVLSPGIKDGLLWVYGEE
ncbi:MAG: alpha/beta hydrolase [Chloroflexi bacterium]|nr:MAG: alpha/beta hydrolase [Chloroflexota bacterium]MBL1192908.1 alpha/beta hydrolase [Chloroflexota bacterium]NOH10201.1 alpha/beta hydrolase [Chloroflexota bacterium]